MKAYTDINQSKLLAKVLPLESADMYWFVPADNEGEFIEKVELIRYKSDYNMFDKVTDWDDTPYVPCWSLAALLAQMPCVELTSSNDGHYRAFWHEKYSGWHSNPVDACTELLNRDHLAENSDLINE